AAAGPHLPRLLPEARRRVPPKFLDRRSALLARDPARRGRLPHPPRAEAPRGGRAPCLRSLPDGAAARPVSDRPRPGHAAGAAAGGGGGGRVLSAFDAALHHRGPPRRVLLRSRGG